MSDSSRGRLMRFACATIVWTCAATAGEAQQTTLDHGGDPTIPLRGIAIDERMADDLGSAIGDTLRISSAPDSTGTPVIVAAITRRGRDPAEIARREYRVRLHLDHIQTLTGYGDRVDRFAVATRSDTATNQALAAINDAAFGFRAYPSRTIAVETSKTFLVVSRFHRAIGVITIVASAIFLLCIMLLKVDERRRDVAALRLMGISAQSIVRSVVIEAAVIALFGSGAGVGIGVAAAACVNWYYQGVYRTPLYFALVSPSIVAGAVALSVVLGIGAGVIAAIRLVKVPVLSLFGR